MPWPCFLIARTPDLKAFVTDEGREQARIPGAMWWASPDSLPKDHSVPAGAFDRFPKLLCVRLPSGGSFHPQIPPAGESHGWEITGEPPKVTIRPSINHVGVYHGYLTDGVLSDDLEGRAL